MKIVVLDGYTMNSGDLSWSNLEKFGELNVYDRTSESEVIERISDSEIVITNKVIIGREVFEKCKNIKYVGVTATGYNVVDTNLAKEFGVTVTNVPAYSTDSVSQLVFSFILEYCQNVYKYNESVKSGDWVNSKDFSYRKFPIVELAGKNLGIIGFGAIGKKVAEIGNAFGMNVIVNTRTISNTNLNVKFVSKEEIFKNSDFLTLHCPLTDETKEIINKNTLELMKTSSFLINTGRGGLVNEKNLADALNLGNIAGAGLDVLSNEPPKEDNPLINAKNTFITPHVAWASYEARNRLMNVTINNVKSFIEGNPINVVNK
ncbi:D-isomer specific 2-hydroxyacid dehydrogenase, NAD-binding protein [Methanococcus maripaludis C5]|uniref:D-isomer specific 2-hydroxyacid dehydrogenase, NAD-binding protein n=1 Tax=Methanococcus maripaludis (strain C5 / ATCC BAA-1333) TaxID=402880 RepID=A4FXQ5_METM5|nr:D-2-hydroxyacid dehydrogenase [Methanococcus maripaludis]ABO34989.1 D-isomer specific 2-hydroxyacid dehydrogenase, NAD-binding protein [Methanococcus maripaludis C5]